MTKLIAYPLGWVMWAIYQVVPNYGISIILFTLFVKLLTIPSTYKMQVNSARQGLLAPKLEKLKKSYGNNPTRLQEEQNRLFTEEGINPSAGCLGSILTMILIFGVYRVVTYPLTYILRIPEETVSSAIDQLQTWLTQQDITEKYLTARPQLILLKYAKTNPEIFSSIEGFVDKTSGFQNNFLGFDLTGVPSLHPENGWSFTAVMLVLLPILSALVQLVMTFITQRHNKRMNPSTAQQMNSMNMMLYLSPIMTIWIGMSVPAGLSFYWFINSLFSLLVTLALYQYLSGDRLVAINEKEKQKQLKKGPSWMQRMMEQSAQYQNEQNGGSSRAEANRTRYADGDDGMSRKERAEYEKKLIEAARKRAADKYGDESLEDDRSLIEAAESRVAKKYGDAKNTAPNQSEDAQDEEYEPDELD